jgi:hypothetical protein
MGRFWGVLRSILLLDEDVSGFVGMAILGVKGSYGWGCFRPEADAHTLRSPPNAKLLDHLIALEIIPWRV